MNEKAPKVDRDRVEILSEVGEISMEMAAQAVYRQYGANLAAFWRDAFAAEIQVHGDRSPAVNQSAVDGNCIHYIPICRQCQLNTIEAHLKEKERIRSEAGSVAGTEKGKS